MLAIVACKGDDPRPAVPPIAVDAAPVPASPATGNVIRGRLTLEGQPFAHRALELCVARDASLHASTPCAKATPRFATRTDATGGYVFGGLPDGAFGIYLLEAPYHTYTMQFPVLAGRASREHDAPIPAPQQPPAETTGAGGNTVRGRLVHRGTPLAHVALELCTAHGWNRDDPTPCWAGPNRRLARADAAGKFVFERVPEGDFQIVMLEQPFYPRMVFVLGLAGGTRELGTKRVRAADEPFSPDADDESADQWPDVRR